MTAKIDKRALSQVIKFVEFGTRYCEEGGVGHLNYLRSKKPNEVMTGLYWTASRACGLGELDNLKLCLQSGLDAHTRDHHYGSLVHVAAYYGQVICLRYLNQLGLSLDLKSGGQGWTPAHCAVCSKGVKALRFLASKGVDLEIQSDLSQQTPRQLAEEWKNIEAIRFIDQWSEAKASKV